MNFKNINLLLASSAAFLGIFVGLKGSDLAKLGYTIGATCSVGIAAGSLISRNKAMRVKHDADKAISLARIDTNKANARAKDEISRNENFLSQIADLQKNSEHLQSEKEHLNKSLQNALQRAAISQASQTTLQAEIDTCKAELATLSAERVELVAELEETLEDLKFATEDSDKLVELKLSEYKQSVHEAYKTRLMANVEKMATSRFNAKSKDLLTQIEIVSNENMNLKKEIDRYEVEFADVQAAIEEGGSDEFDFNAYMGDTLEAYTTRITELTTKIEILETELAKASEPQYFIGSSREYEPGNKVIKFVWESRNIALDGAWRAVSGTTETFYFQLRKTADIKPARECINSSLEDIRIATGCKNVSPCEWDSEKALLKFTCTNHVQILNKNAIEALWIPAHKFPSLVARWERIRITGASEGAKSPLARNILGAKLLNGEKFELVRFDPSGGSKKDYWRIEADSNDFADLPQLMKRISQDATGEERKVSTDKVMRFYVIDEVDICFGRISKPELMATSLKELAKHGSHTSVGCILAGQNANVSNYKGFQRSDCNSFVNIHVGANVHDALTNSNDGSKVTELIANARTLIDYCDRENETREIENRLQVALVEEKGKRYFIQLPKLGEFGFDKHLPGATYDFKPGFSTANYADNLRSLNQALIEGVVNSKLTLKADPQDPQKVPQEIAVNPAVSLPFKPPKSTIQRCPHCLSDKVGSKGAERLICKSCKKSFPKSKAITSN